VDRFDAPDAPAWYHRLRRGRLRRAQTRHVQVLQGHRKEQPRPPNAAVKATIERASTFFKDILRKNDILFAYVIFLLYLCSAKVFDEKPIDIAQSAKAYILNNESAKLIVTTRYMSLLSVSLHGWAGCCH